MEIVKSLLLKDVYLCLISSVQITQKNSGGVIGVMMAVR